MAEMELKLGETYTEVVVEHFEYNSPMSSSLNSSFSLAVKLMNVASAAAASTFRRISESLNISVNTIEVAMWQQLEFFPEFYEKAFVPSDPLTNFRLRSGKFKALHQRFPVGRSSQRIANVLTDYDSGTPLVWSESYAVNWDISARHSTPYHPLYKGYFTPENCVINTKAEKKLLPQCRKRAEIPPNATVCSRTASINVRQIDINNHLNNAKYIELCFDCLGDAFAQSIFGDTGSLTGHRLQRISCLYFKELLLGDEVETTVWQDEKNPLVFRFHVKKEEDLTLQCEFQLFPQNDVSPRI